MKVGHVGNVLHSFLALSPILHNELISTKREIFAPRGPGVDAEYRNKRALIEASNVFQYVMFDQFPQLLSLKNDSKRDEN